MQKWNDFKENVNAAFVKLRDANDFSDVTLACDDKIPNVKEKTVEGVDICKDMKGGWQTDDM